VASTVRFNLQIDLSAEQVNNLTGLVSEESLNDTQKLSKVAEEFLGDVAGGGLVLSPAEMARITEATGLEVECGEELIPLLSEATGREEGKMTFKCSVDPVYEEYYEEAANAQGRTVKELIQDIWDIFMDGDPMQYNMGNAGYPQLVRMMPKDREAIEKLLGAKFETGTDLVKLIQESLGGGLFSESAAEPSAVQEKQ
jgi:hypothetical protein